MAENDGEEAARTLDRLRRPEYTGANRCLPCTAVNLGLAAVATAAVAVVSRSGAALVSLASLTTIYLRGYLVPGTPALTRQYLPESARSWFGKATASPEIEVGEGVDEASVEEILAAAGVVTECEDVDDVCLTDSFRRAWVAGIDERGADPVAFADAIGVGPEDVTVDESGHVFVRVSDVRRDQWGTRTALVADAAAAAELRAWGLDWEALPLGTRHGVLRGLRVFLETCPLCGGPIGLGEQQVESGCCGGAGTVDVMRCEACEETVMELEPGTV